VLCQVSVTVHVSVIGAGQDGHVEVQEDPVVGDAIAGEAVGEGAAVVLCEDVVLELLQVVQRAVCGKNSRGSLIVKDPDFPADAIVEVKLGLERTPMLDGFVAAARILPTMLVASPTTPPTILVACCI